MPRKRPNINKEDTWKMVKPEDVPQATLKMVQKELVDHRKEMVELLDTRLNGIGGFMQMAANNRMWLQIFTVLVIIVFVVGGLILKSKT